MSKEIKETLKEKIKNAISVEESMEVDGFDELYVVTTRRKDDSRFYVMEIYGLKEDKVYTLTRSSDLIVFEKVIDDFDWFLSIDVPEPSIIRMFTRSRIIKIYVSGRNIGDFIINIE